MTCDWLPALVCLGDCGGDHQKYFEAVYKIFERDFISTPPKWVPPIPINIKPAKKAGEWSETFWHMTSEGPDEEQRTPAINRCERMAWPKQLMVEYCRIIKEKKAGDRIYWWKKSVTGQDRLLLSLCDFGYIVILAVHRRYVIPITTYPVEHENRKNKLKKEYENYWNAIK